MCSMADDPSVSRDAIRAELDRADMDVRLWGHVGIIVHVLTTDATGRPACRPALVMDDAPRDGMLSVRVLIVTPAGMDAGAMDGEGWYRHHSARRIVANPDGSTRALDSWHGYGYPGCPCALA